MSNPEQLYIQRLLDTAEMLEGVPDERFDLTGYAYEGGCGTVACVLGHLALSGVDGWHIGTKRWPDRNNSGKNPITLGYEYFGIQRTRADNLFMRRSGYHTRAHAIARLREYAAAKQAAL